MTDRIDILQLPDHSPRGPSAAERWLYRPDPETGEMLGCPASVRLTEDLPDTESWYAAEGTAAHWISELCRVNDKPASEYLDYSDDKMPNPQGGNFTCDHEMVDGVQRFLDYVNSLPGSVALFEPKVTYFTWVPDDGFGTSDDIRIDELEGVCYVTDLKYGKGVQVFVKNNIQLMVYALGIWEMFHDIYDWDTFKLAISQPRLDHIDEWEISVKDLLEWAEELLRPGAELTREEDAPINAGGWCRWCRLKARCRTRANWILSFGAGENQAMDNEALALMLPHLTAIRGWCNDVEGESMKEVQGGAYVGGYYLGGRRISKNTRRDNNRFEQQRKNYKIKVGEVYERVPISPAQFEKRFGKTHAMMGNVISPQGKPKLSAPNSGDKRYGPDSDTEFDDMPELADWEQQSFEDDLLS